MQRNYGFSARPYRRDRLTPNECVLGVCICLMLASLALWVML